MAVIDELTGSKNSRNELGAIDNRIQARLEKTNQVFRRITLAAGSFGKDCAELLFAQVAIVTLQLLLGTELHAEIGELALAALTMLARTIFTTIDRGLRTTPDVFTHTAIKFIFRRCALAHRISFLGCISTCCQAF